MDVSEPLAGAARTAAAYHIKILASRRDKVVSKIRTANSRAATAISKIPPSANGMFGGDAAELEKVVKLAKDLSGTMKQTFQGSFSSKFEPNPVNLLNFLTYFYEVKRSEYRTLNCYRSAISSTLAPDPRTGIPVGQDPLVSRFFKGIKRLRPPKKRLFPTWSVSSVLRYLKSLGESKNLNLYTHFGSFGVL